MTFTISDKVWRDLITEFESQRYPNYEDEKVWYAWDIPLDKLPPNILKLIFDLYKRIDDLEQKVKA